MQSYLDNLAKKYPDLTLPREYVLSVGLNTTLTSDVSEKIETENILDMTSSNAKILKYWPNLIVHGCRTGDNFDLLEKMFIEFPESNDIFVVKSGTYLQTKEKYPFDSTFQEVTLAYLKHFGKSLMTLLNLVCQTHQFRYFLKLLKLYWSTCMRYPVLTLGKDILYLRILKELFRRLCQNFPYKQRELIITHKLITDIFECSSLRNNACYFVYFDEDYYEALWGLPTSRIETTTNICCAYTEKGKIKKLKDAFYYANDTDTFSSLDLTRIVASSGKSNTSLKYLQSKLKEFTSFISVEFLRNVYKHQFFLFEEFLDLFLRNSNREFILLVKFLVDICYFKLTAKYLEVKSRHVSDTRFYMTILYHLDPVNSLSYATTLRDQIYSICDKKGINIVSQMQHKLKYKLAKFELKEFLLKDRAYSFSLENAYSDV